MRGEMLDVTKEDQIKALVGNYIDRHPVPTCLRNHAFLQEVNAGVRRSNGDS